MKTWKKYLFIYIPIGIFCCIINFNEITISLGGKNE